MIAAEAAVTPFDPSNNAQDALAVWMTKAGPRDVWDIEDAESKLDKVYVVRRVIPNVRAHTAVALLRILNY